MASVGVQRQYSDTPGRTDNCPVGVFANYRSTKGHTFVDRRLFLPEDAARRPAAGVPAGVVFRTKPALAVEMFADAVAGVPFRWAGGDRVCGNNKTIVRLAWNWASGTSWTSRGTLRCGPRPRG